MLLYSRVAAPKVPKRRSRAGCAHCKDKKKKCDEIRPRCSRCQEQDHECIYEAVRPRQRHKRDSPTGLTLDDLSSAGAVFEEEVFTPQSASSDSRSRWFDDVLTNEAGMAGHDPTKDMFRDYRFPQQILATSRSMSFGGQGSFAWRSAADDMISLPATTSGDFTFPPYDDASSTRDDDVDEEIIRRDSIVSSRSTTTTSNHPSLALIAPVPLRSPTLEFCAPVFEEFSQRTNRRALVDHFCNVLSHLIVFREENGNPFQQLVLPLSGSSTVVMDAIYALASAHLEFRGVGNAEKSVYFHNNAIQGLARLIQHGAQVDKKELLASIMLLVYYEVLVQRGRSNIVDGHLKGAMSILSNNRQALTDPAGVFLERAFRFYDVIAALSFGTAPLSSAPGQGCVSPFPPLDSSGVASPAGSVDTLLGMATSLWPIIHRLSTLLQLKEDLEDAVRQGETNKRAVLRTEFEATASAINVALQAWQPILPPDCVLAKSIDEIPSDKIPERSRLQSILNNALAYRHSALVYLYRSIYAYSRSNTLVQRHAHLSLTHCVGTVSNEGPMGALLWPLFVAACEARDLADRDLAARAFEAIDRHQGMTNIQRAWCIVQEVWRRADEAEVMATADRLGEEVLPGAVKPEEVIAGARKGGELWRRVSEDMGVTIVFG